ncbi:Antitoxin component YwqK of the YwqJK toxin-antitoxin module [Aquimarina amphilecti]|uniref:Antitoxin component YwqK of the YwqJK toxin-antitoxin module n=1 Tax=Aquimarina amphilecti TaxID=1038014 RepID=A0A1H7Q719_AQUAM|nr:toxin-antitoxin system YwqK family antitoxin [Aquimarina amphilecti]SEL43773.1 Antitoxin component YwqK of the YwqJK toxin-antitoxin module [Aquimarina amphilecti]
MNARIKLVSLALITTFSLTQCTLNNKKNTNENVKISVTDTIKIEKFKNYYASGNLKSEGQLINKEKTGEWISYYENGEQESIRNYKNDLLDGYQKIDYSQVLYMEGSYKEGIKIGEWKSYFKKNKKLKYLRHFDNKGRATGEWKNYYDSGELINIENYSNGSQNGKQVEYFKNGNISKVGEKQNGKENGVWKYYYDNGTLRCEREFKNGVDHGKYVEYFKNSKIYKIGAKQNFKKVGTWKTYDKQGDLVETVSYNN